MTGSKKTLETTIILCPIISDLDDFFYPCQEAWKTLSKLLKC